MRIAVAALLALIAYVLPRAEREYREQGRLTGATSAAGWAAYVLHWTTFAASLPGGISLRLPKRLSRVAGGVLSILGGVLFAAGMKAFRSFGQVSGTSNDGLVTDGVFRYSRNPQNVGGGLFLTGAALAARRRLSLLMALGFWPVFLRYARGEEAHLERAYGDEYRRYRKQAPRVLGWPRDAG